jgi:hypothetical protein
MKKTIFNTAVITGIFSYFLFGGQVMASDTIDYSRGYSLVYSAEQIDVSPTYVDLDEEMKRIKERKKAKDAAAAAAAQVAEDQSNCL